MHYHESVCGTALDADMDAVMTELDNVKPSGCNECDEAWSSEKGCPSGSASASASGEASASARMLLAEKFGIDEELASVKG